MRVLLLLFWWKIVCQNHKPEPESWQRITTPLSSLCHSNTANPKLSSRAPTALFHPPVERGYSKAFPIFRLFLFGRSVGERPL